MSDPAAPPTPTVTVRRGDTVREIAPDQVADFQREGWSPETPDQQAERVVTGAQSDNEGTVAPLAVGALRGATFGLSDVALRAMGDEDSLIQLRHMQENHGTASLIGELGGALATGGAVGKLGGAVEGLTGSSIAGAAAEGATYGLGSGASQLALSDDPITAEHALSVLSSNALLGAGFGGGLGVVSKAGERALVRAGELLDRAGAARAALEGVPADLQSLDEAGLKGAAQTEKASLKTQAEAERASLEDLRSNQREEMAAQVKDLHDQLAEESPIYHAVQGEDVAKIAGVNDIKVQLAKSFKTMRAQFDDPIGIAKNPEYLVRPLRMRQAALEQLQAKAPELQAALAGDARSAALGQVDDALAATKDQIARIESIAGKNQQPLASGRLAVLESGSSPRLDAIEKAREALRSGPELGLVGKGAKAAVFAGGTAVAHMIPGVGIAAPFVGKSASELVGKLFGHLSGAVRATSEKTSAALKQFLTVGEKLAPPARMTATKVLSAVRFGAGPEAESDDLHGLYKARATELRQQTMYAPDGSTVMRPEARAAMAKRIAPIATVNPLLADKIETAAARKVAYLSSKLPKHPEVQGMQIGPDKWRPSDLQMRAFARCVRGAEDPSGVEERLSHGTVTPEEAEAYRVCYPERFASLQQAIAAAAPTLAKTLPVKRKVALFVFTGVPTMPALMPNVLKQLQANFAIEPGSAGGTSAPMPAPNFGALGSLKSVDKPTPAQQREGA